MSVDSRVALQAPVLPPVYIAALLRFTLPPFSTSPSTPNIEDWFSKEAPSLEFTIAQLAKIPLPSNEVIRRLAEAFASQELLSIRSIKAVHLAPGSPLVKHLPLWIISYWSSASQAKRSQICWDAAIRWVEKQARGSAEGRELQKDVLAQLAELRWDGDLHGPDVGYGSVNMLSNMLSDSRLSGAHIAQMLSTIRRQLDHSSFPNISPHLIMDIEFFDSLRDAYNTPDSIASERRFKTVRNVEADIASGHKTIVSGVIFINGNHYTSFILDLQQQELAYSDSLGQTMPESLEKIFRWWIGRLITLDHAPAASGSQKPLETWFTSLPVTKQPPFDDYSCGILAIDALRHRLLANPLLTSDSRSIALARMRRFTEICVRHFEAPTRSGDPVPATKMFEFQLALPELHLAASPHRPIRPLPGRAISSGSDVPCNDSMSEDSSVPALDRAASPHTKVTKAKGAAKTATSIQSFFPRISADTYQKQEKQSWAALAETLAGARERESLARAQKELDVRENNRKRQQISRAKRKAQSEQEGKGKVRKLKAFDDISTPDTSMVAEDSRPWRTKQKSHQDAPLLGKREPGRPSKNTHRAACRVNWQQPALWSQIVSACDYVGYPWSPLRIQERLEAVNPRTFKGKSMAKRICDWRDRTITDRLVWQESVLKKVANRNQAGGKAGRHGVLADHPKLVAAITEALTKMRQASVQLDLVTVRGLMIGLMQHHAPELFDLVDKRGKRFNCSDAFVRRFLKRTMNWRLRRTTRAGQKIPVNAPELLRKTCLRAGAIIRDENILDCFVVNTDQTQVVYSSGGKLTYHTRGEKQVQVEGVEEKRAFTAVVGVSMSGEVLPFQIVYQGSDVKRSLPSATSPCMDQANDYGFRFEVSKTKTYWSTQETMQTYVQDVLAPYYQKHRERLDRPNQICLWLIDVWSVHRSLEFRTWMKEHYPWIVVHFVPGGCTGLMQPCDVGIQRPLKHAIKRSAHKNTVDETLMHLRNGVAPSLIKLDKTIGTLRNRSVEWLVNGYNAVNQPDLVKKAWQHCVGGQFNLSYVSLSSREMRQALNEVSKSDPQFYLEITQGSSQVLNETNKTYVEDEEPDDLATCDPSSDSTKRVIQRTLATAPETVETEEVSDSDNDEGVAGYEDVADMDGEVVSVLPANNDGNANGEPSARRSGRKRTANRRYDNTDWLNNDSSDDDL